MVEILYYKLSLRESLKPRRPIKGSTKEIPNAEQNNWISKSVGVGVGVVGWGSNKDKCLGEKYQ